MFDYYEEVTAEAAVPCQTIFCRSFCRAVAVLFCRGCLRRPVPSVRACPSVRGGGGPPPRSGVAAPLPHASRLEVVSGCTVARAVVRAQVASVSVAVRPARARAVLPGLPQASSLEGACGGPAEVGVVGGFASVVRGGVRKREAAGPCGGSEPPRSRGRRGEASSPRPSEERWLPG